MANLRALQHVIHTAPLEIPHQAPELARHCRQAAIVTNLGLERRIENPGLFRIHLPGVKIDDGRPLLLPVYLKDGPAGTGIGKKTEKESGRAWWRERV